MSKRARTTVVTAAAATTVLATLGFAAPASGTESASNRGGVTVPAGFTANVIARSTGAAVAGPDDITSLDGNLYVGYQNGVGTMGEPAPSGATASTLVEYDPAGHELAHWNLTGKVDGLGADPRTHQVIATVNEDGNSSIYTVGAGGQVRHYTYNANPLPHGGGTDSVTVHNGVVYLAASNPATDAAGSTGDRPAMYRVRFDGNTAELTPVFPDDIAATNLVTGTKSALNLTDPDSSGWIPSDVPGVGNTLMLDSQGDQELVFVKRPGAPDQSASVLPLTESVDDTVPATDAKGTLYVVDAGQNRVIAITGDFTKNEVFTSGSGLSTLDLRTGQVTPFGSGITPRGLLFAPATGDDQNNQN